MWVNAHTNPLGPDDMTTTKETKALHNCVHIVWYILQRVGFPIWVTLFFGKYVQVNWPVWLTPNPLSPCRVIWLVSTGAWCSLHTNLLTAPLEQPHNRKLSILGCVIFRRHTVLNFSNIANCFSNYLVNIDPKLASKLLKINGTFLPERTTVALLLEPSEEVAIKIIRTLKGTPGKDGITVNNIKYIAEHITSSVAQMVDLSFEQGICSKELKIPLVSLLYKANGPMLFNDCWPISLLSVLSTNHCLWASNTQPFIVVH